MLSHRELRNIYKKFWEERGHTLVPPAPLVLSEDPTTLFTSSGMQKLVPFLMGEKHSLGTKIFDIQRCIRTQDIEEVGDNRHDTFFEMMGNWSLGDYFKKEQLPWILELFTKEFQFDKDKIYVSVFKGNSEVPKDTEAIEIWKSLGIPEERIYEYDVEKNWWSRSGPPSKMPAGEIGGPCSEMFYDFGTPHDSKFGTECHPNCDCGRFIEIGNNVFIQYKKKEDGSLEELPQKNVDFGGGFERFMAVHHKSPDIFVTDLYKSIIEAVEKKTGKSYSEESNKPAIRIIADHIKGAAFLIYDGVRPSNKEHGYILRRLLRRAMIKMRSLDASLEVGIFDEATTAALKVYDNNDGIIYSEKATEIIAVINEEITRFAKTLDKGLRLVEKMTTIDGKGAFDLYQSYGFPLEITEELFKQKGQEINKEEFYLEFTKHRDLSRTSSAGKFKGGLADQNEQTVRYHTATHLLNQALTDVLNEVRQEGSNITGERLRFDFSAPRKLEPTEVKKIEEIINQKIKESIPVNFQIMPKEEASKIGAKSFFREKYPDNVKIYYIGKDLKTAYSIEFCGGPHVKNTAEIGNLEIYKYEKIGANLFRIYAK